MMLLACQSMEGVLFLPVDGGLVVNSAHIFAEVYYKVYGTTAGIGSPLWNIHQFDLIFYHLKDIQLLKF